MGLLRIILRADEETFEPLGRPTMHGSRPKREMAKHGGQAMRWRDVEHQEGRRRGGDADRPRPRGSGERP
jgi:hypothetical protein